jgi:ketosteroid isomerase-like protein
MSQENVETARTVVAAFNAGDWDRYFEQLDPRIEWWDRADDPGASVHRGHEGIRTWLAELDEMADVRIQATEFVDIGDCVFVSLRLHGRGKASGAQFEANEVHALAFRDGKVFEAHEYHDLDEAIAAMGLAE